jgi:hypothetical protein
VKTSHARCLQPRSSRAAPALPSLLLATCPYPTLLKGYFVRLSKASVESKCKALKASVSEVLRVAERGIDFELSVLLKEACR